MAIHTYSLCLLALFSISVVASQYCQCENVLRRTIFPGINRICRDLSNDWCSTNCDKFGGPVTIASTHVLEAVLFVFLTDISFMANLLSKITASGL
jgi:hypothetical protein